MIKIKACATAILFGLLSSQDNATVSAQYQQICRVYSAVYFKDSQCQERSAEQPDARAVAEFDSVVRNGATCVQAEPNAPLKMSVICNSDGSVQKNYFNLAKEDPDCLKPYGPGSVIQSVTIRSGECF